MRNVNQILHNSQCVVLWIILCCGGCLHRKLKFKEFPKFVKIKIIFEFAKVDNNLKAARSPYLLVLTPPVRAAQLFPSSRSRRSNPELCGDESERAR